MVVHKGYDKKLYITDYLEERDHQINACTILKYYHEIELEAKKHKKQGENRKVNNIITVA